jgi:hypothetical protein
MPSAHFAQSPVRVVRLRSHWVSSLFFGVCVFTLSQELAHADLEPPLCWTEQPVVDIHTDWTPTEDDGSQGLTLGPVRLPLAAWRPEILTEARLSWVYHEGFHSTQRISPNRGLEVFFTFPDPRPFGLPYTVQGFILDSHDGGVLVDWSHGCEDPGVSVFPGQSYRESLNLAEEPAGPQLPSSTVRLRIWGSRN